jgi:uncharacterized protein YjbI with pentapeptide repeats
MAVEEYLEIIRQGVDAWNEWKAKNPNSRPELDDVNLRSAQLSSVNLYHANLSHAKAGQFNYFFPIGAA